MRKLLLCWLILSCQQSFSQTRFTNNFESRLTFGQSAEDIAYENPHKRSFSEYIQKMQQGNFEFMSPTVASTSSAANYDVKYYRLELRLNPDSTSGPGKNPPKVKYIRGKITTYFKTLIPNFAVVSFDFQNALLCDSVYYHGSKLAAGNAVKQVDSLKITLTSPLSLGTLDSVSIYYEGVPIVTPDLSSQTGFVSSTHNGGADNYIYTLSESYSAFTWWPCKSFIVDKADSMDMIVSTPTNFKVAGNGTLVSETTIGSNLFTYWKERYPIASYQICTAVANYLQYPTVADTVVMGTTKMPLYNYLFPETLTPASQTSLDRVKLMMTTFNSLFGDYPFKKEKYGNYTFGLNGGMEHNTFSGEGPGVYNAAGDWDVLAHELAHQWWGDNVSCSSWQDIWLHESFADYSEVLCAEFAPSVPLLAGNTALSWRQGKKSLVVNGSNNARAVFVTDTSSVTSIFTPGVYIYERGGMVVSMLRTLLGDTKFFQALKNYQSDPLLAQSVAFTSDIKRHMEAVSGLDLSTFFTHWIYNTGFAQYSGATWNNVGKSIVMRLPQTTNGSGLSHFDMPISVWIHGAAGQDTAVVLYDKGGTMYYDTNGILTSSGSNTVQYNLSFVPTRIVFDSLSQVTATGSFAPSSSLALLASHLLSFSGNRSGIDVKLFWKIDNAFDYSSFDIERSEDGVRFSKIADLQSNDFPGNSSFSFTDHNALSGTSYYRIKVNQKDGSVIYSSVIAIANVESDGLYTITPNPAKDFILIKKQANNTVAEIRLFGASGKEVKRIIKPTFSNNTLNVSVTNLIAGNYFVELKSADNQKQTKKIVIIK